MTDAGKRRLYSACEALCLLLAVWLSLGMYRNNNPLFGQIGQDNAIFLCVGRGMVEGLTPYVDMIENKGPLFFLMMALPQKMVQGIAGVFVLEVLMMLGTLTLLLACLRYLSGERRSFVALLALTLVFLSMMPPEGNFTEEHDVIFVTLGLWVLVHTYTGQKRGACLRAFWLGVATAGVLLIKASDVLGLAALLFFYLIEVLRAKKSIWKEALGYLAGLAVLCVPVFLYLIRVDAVGPMLRQYILNNFVHVVDGRHLSSVAVRLYLLKSAYGRSSLWPLAAMAGAIVLQVIASAARGKRPNEAFLLLCAAGFALGNFAVAYVAPTGFTQHLFMSCLTYWFAAMLALDALDAVLLSRVKPVRWAALAAAAVMFGCACVEGAQRVSPQALTQAKETREQLLRDNQAFSELWEGKSVYALGMNPQWYWFNHVQPKYGYYHVIGFIADTVGEGLAEWFESELQKDPAEVLVVYRPVEDYKGILTDETIAYIRAHYEVAATEDPSKGQKQILRLMGQEDAADESGDSAGA